MAEQKKISLRVLDGQTEFAEDEIQKLSDIVNVISKPVFYIALIAAIGFFGFRFYNDAQITKQKSGAEQLAIVQATFDEFEVATAALEKSKPEEKEKNQKALKDIEVKISEQIKTLGDRPEPYKKVATIYEKLIKRTDSSTIEQAQELKNVVKGLIVD
jgi:hypothetical protein